MHISSGVSALVCAIYLGKRTGYPKQPMPPHSLVLSFIGACLLWVGWFGFNAGSALASNSLATSAFVATHFAAAAAALSWSAAEWLKNGRASARCIPERCRTRGNSQRLDLSRADARADNRTIAGPLPLMVTKVKAIWYDDASMPSA